MLKINVRKQRGSLAGLLMATVLLCVLSLGTLGTDFCHILAVRNELQNAADAAALAGGLELWKDATKCETIARKVASLNYADGKAVVDGENGIVVRVAVTPPQPPSVQGRVQVDAEVPIRHLMAQIFGRTSDRVTAHAVAGTQGQLTEVYADQMFPLAIEASRGNNGMPLSSAGVGSIVQLDLNSQNWKNAGWTSLTHNPANSAYIWGVIDQRLGLSKPVPGFTPSVELGDDIYLLNGIMSGKKLADGPYMERLLDPDREPFVMPVVEGDPAMNQKQKVIGFLGLRITNVITGQKGGRVETIIGRIERLQINGGSGTGGSGGPNISKLQPGPIQLIE
jgi:Flp pilus assembly protein TadG